MDNLNTLQLQSQLQSQLQTYPHSQSQTYPQSQQNLLFDISQDFKLRDILEKKNSPQSIESSETLLTNQSKPIDTEQMNVMIRSLPFMNDYIRTNIKFSIELYKELINFDRKYIYQNIIYGK